MNEYNQFTDWRTPSSELERRSQENLERIWRETEARRQRLAEKYEKRAKVTRFFTSLCALENVACIHVEKLYVVTASALGHEESLKRRMKSRLALFRTCLAVILTSTLDLSLVDLVRNKS